MADTEHAKPKGRPLIIERDSEPHGPPPGSRRPVTPVTRALVSSEVIRVQGEVVEDDPQNLAGMYEGARNALLRNRRGIGPLAVSALSELWSEFNEPVPSGGVRVVNPNTLAWARTIGTTSAAQVLTDEEYRVFLDVIDTISSNSVRSRAGFLE